MEKIVTISNKRDLKEERKYCKIIKEKIIIKIIKSLFF